MTSCFVFGYVCAWRVQICPTLLIGHITQLESLVGPYYAFLAVSGQNWARQASSVHVCWFLLPSFKGLPEILLRSVQEQWLCCVAAAQNCYRSQNKCVGVAIGELVLVGGIAPVLFCGTIQFAWLFSSWRSLCNHLVHPQTKKQLQLPILMLLILKASMCFHTNIVCGAVSSCLF